MKIERWTEERDRDLLRLKEGGMQVAVIAKKLKRTESAVTARLVKLKKKPPAPIAW
jgi:hypothetical protein